MSLDYVLALAGFAFVTSVTPGPSNLILLASGLNFGFRRSLPTALGVSHGFLTMLLLTGLGLGRILQAGNIVSMALRILCLLYILYLAWKIARSRPGGGPGDNRADTPLSYFQAGLLQWVNPKAWAVAMAATVSFTEPETYSGSLAVLIIVFAVINLPSISLWAASGMFFRKLMNNPVKVRVFNIIMASVLVISLFPVLMDLGR